MRNKGIGEIISHSTSHKSSKITEKCKERRLILLSEFKKLRDLINKRIDIFKCS